MVNKIIEIQKELINVQEIKIGYQTMEIMHLKECVKKLENENLELEKEIKELKDFQRAKEIHEIALNKIKGEINNETKNV